MCIFSAKKENNEKMKQKEEESEKGRMKFLALIKAKEEDRDKMERTMDENINDINLQHQKLLQDKEAELIKVSSRFCKPLLKGKLLKNTF